MLSRYAEEEYARRRTPQGRRDLYHGYLLKERVSHLDDLVQPLSTVGGGAVVDPKVGSLVAHKVRAAQSPLRRLTDREREVLQQMAEGKNNGAIARSLFLGERAIEKRINTMFSRWGLTHETDVHRRVMAVLTFPNADTAMDAEPTSGRPPVRRPSGYLPHVDSS